MLDLINKLARVVAPRIRAFGYTHPTVTTLEALLRTAYLSSLHTEEGRFIRSSLTYANPRNPHGTLPPVVRAYYPRFSRFARFRSLTPTHLTKLGRAVDEWSGSIAVWGTTPTALFAWGVVDQLDHTNARLHRVTETGFSHPGILTIVVGGVADLSVYHEDVFLGALRADSLITHQSDAFHSNALRLRLAPYLAPIATAIATRLGDARDSASILAEYFGAWSDTIARLCIGLRRIGTGGAFLITPSPQLSSLSISTPFRFRRLGESVALRLLDRRYLYMLENQRNGFLDADTLPMSLSVDLSFAEGDLEDRDLEVSGAAKLVTSLAAVDGLVLMSPELFVRGFGVKIGPGRPVATVYDGSEFIKRGARASTIDISRFGTRHASMLRYCRDDPKSVGVVISQDGAVRITMAFRRSVILWDNVKLLGHDSFSQSAVRSERELLSQWAAMQYRSRRGFSPMPKTLSALLRRTGGHKSRQVQRSSKRPAAEDV